MKQIVVLVGPKGAGKSTIGALLSDALGVHFLRVEPLFLAVRDRLGASHPSFERAGFESVLLSLDEALRRHDTVCIESTGASPRLGWLLDELRARARVHLVRVLAEPSQCLTRIRSRDASVHIPVSDDRVEAINAVAGQVALPWSAEIDNRGAFDRDGIRDAVARLIGDEEHPGA